MRQISWWTGAFLIHRFTEPVVGVPGVPGVPLSGTRKIPSFTGKTSTLWPSFPWLEDATFTSRNGPKICMFQRFPQPAFDTGGYAQSKHILGISNHILGILRDFPTFSAKFGEPSRDFSSPFLRPSRFFRLYHQWQWNWARPVTLCDILEPARETRSTYWGCREVSEPSELSGFYLHIYIYNIIYIYKCVCVCACM